ncbi:MAG: hypothetical protein K0S48_400 [Ramlibacter sp.]|nr:hypothetical protein [Ramlibacter sp.]
MPGVMGSGGWPFFCAQVCGVSRKLNHSNSMPVITWKPSFSARASTRLSTCRGHSGCGERSALTNSPRKKGTSLSHGTLRAVPRSTAASASGKPCCQPVTLVLS